MNTRVVLFCRKLFVLCLCFMMFFSFLSASSFAFSNAFNRSYFTCNALPDFGDIFKNFFKSPFKNTDDDTHGDEYVYLGGFPIGLTMESDGVIVIAKGTVTTDLGEVNTTLNSDIKVGDIISYLDDYKISSTRDIALFLENKYVTGEPLKITLFRGSNKIITTMFPAKELITEKNKLGLWVRDTASGVGTMTFIKETGEFSALGHPISDIDTSSKIEIKSGNVYKCNIVGVQKGSVGNPGELRGLFLRNGASIGTITCNTDYGVKGFINSTYLNKMGLKKVKVARKGAVKAGKATILSTIDGVTPEEFDIEIVKLSLQNTPDKKSMILHVTDKDLLERTGGIVQGMSGSPIIQNGKIVGAVTHVFVNDPTRGYGLYMDWMLD